MEILGRSVGLWCGRRRWGASDNRSVIIQLGFGEGSGKEYDRLYRRNLDIEIRPLGSCCLWYQQFLTVENGEPVYQDRICGFWRWPISVNWS